jgi:hypothetical protein
MGGLEKKPGGSSLTQRADAATTATAPGKHTLTSELEPANSSSRAIDNGGQLAYMLATPASGLGDPVVIFLLSLQLPELLEELAEAVVCGYALQLEARVAAAPPILSAALQAVVLARTTPMTRNHPALQRAGAALDRVSRDQQIQILSWMLHRHGVSIEATRLVEGVIAMREDGAPSEGERGDSAETGTPDGEQESDEHTLGESIDGAIASVQSTGSCMPTPIHPEKWAPGDQPGGMYVGNDVHDKIAEHYAASHIGDRLALNTRPLSTIIRWFEEMSHDVHAEALSDDELARKPDILNLRRRHIYEIKPAKAQGEGATQVRMYVRLLERAGINVDLGPMGEPGTIGAMAAPGGVFRFTSSEPGLITYEYNRGKLVPVPVPFAQQSRSNSKEKERWRWELQPLKLTPAQQQAVVTTTVGAAMLLIVMILLAPVGA